MAETRYKRGARVAVLNRTMGGTIVFEGWAKVRGPVVGFSDRYLVTFESEPGQKYERFIDPAAQDDPVAYVDKLKAELAEARAAR